MWGETKIEYVDKIKEVPTYITVPAYGMYNDLWQNENYLKEVSGVVDTRVWITEVTETIKQIRDLADKAKTPEELNGYNRAIGIVKNLLSLTPQAQFRLNDIDFKKQQKAENDKQS